MNPNLNPALADRVLDASEWERFRAWHEQNLAENVMQGFTAPLAGVMVGTNALNQNLGQFLSRRVPVGAQAFRYKVFGKERFIASDTRRGVSAPFKTAGRLFNYATGSLTRRGFAAALDRDDMANADAIQNLFGGDVGIDLRYHYGRIASDRVENDLETVRAALVLALSATTLTTPWDDPTDGDSKASIVAAANALASANNVSPLQIGVILTRASREAALNDPALIAANRAFGTLPVQPTLERLRDYWGVGEVRELDFWYSTTGSNMVSAYGDIAVLYVMRNNLAGVDTRENSNDGFCDFDWSANGGLHLTPVYKGVETDGMATTWLFPYESWATPTLVNSGALSVIKNTKS